MDLEHLPFNWFDFTVVIVLLLGVVRGRRNGLSQELLVMLEWVAMIFGAAFTYEPVGRFMRENSVFSELFCYVTSYFVMAVVINIFFRLVKRAIGGKLTGSDTFGAGEYYLGMFAGLVRFACIIVFFLALLNARYFSPAEIKAMKKYNDYNYGSDFFPGVHSVQTEVFQKACIGPFLSKHISFLLIKPTASAPAPLKRKEFQVP